MKTLTAKLHSRRGETLVEVLASVLICTLAVLLLMSFAVAAMRIDKTAETGDEAFYAALSAAEARDKAPTTDPPLPTPTSGSVTVTEKDPPANTVNLSNVQFYGGDGIYSFAEAAGGGAGP